jgi:hypothetical protein
MCRKSFTGGSLEVLSQEAPGTYRKPSAVSQVGRKKALTIVLRVFRVFRVTDRILVFYGGQTTVDTIHRCRQW